MNLYLLWTFTSRTVWGVLTGILLSIPVDICLGPKMTEYWFACVKSSNWVAICHVSTSAPMTMAIFFISKMWESESQWATGYVWAQQENLVMFKSFDGSKVRFLQITPCGTCFAWSACPSYIPSIYQIHPPHSCQMSCTTLWPNHHQNNHPPGYEEVNSGDSSDMDLWLQSIWFALQLQMTSIGHSVKRVHDLFITSGSSSMQSMHALYITPEQVWSGGLGGEEELCLVFTAHVMHLTILSSVLLVRECLPVNVHMNTNELTMSSVRGQRWNLYNQHWLAVNIS